MSDLLGIGASAVATYQNALSVVGENVANVDTPGYARRDVTIRELANVGGTSPLYRGTIASSGSETTGVTRAWDAFKSSDAMAATADDARASAAATWLDPAASAIDASDNGVAAKVSAIFTGATTLAADPTSPVARTQMFGALGDASAAIAGSATRLAKISSGISDAAATAVDGANSDLSALARVNAALLRTPNNTDAKAALADQRDQFLSDLAGRIGIDAKIGSDGTATVTLSGSSGTTLLSGGTNVTLGVNTAADGRLAFVAGLGTSVTAISPASGAAAGLADAANTVAGSRQNLDAIASDFATKLNAWNAQGTTRAGTAGQPLFAIAGGAAGLTLAATSPDAIAAASTDGTANGNLLAIGNLRGPDGTEARLTALVSANAQTLASANAQSAAAATRKSAALTARDDTSGVSLDQQAADLVRYQQAYAGSAKIIQAAQTTLQAILALF